MNPYRSPFKTEICELYGTMTYKSIAKHLGTSRGVVAGIVNRYVRPIGNVKELHVNVTQKGCRWIHGDPPAEWHWCGVDIKDNGSYCDKHRSIVYKKVASSSEPQ